MQKVPNISTFSGLKGIEARIQDLQDIVGKSIQYSFGLCKRIRSDKDEDMPVVFLGNKNDVLDVRPWPDDVYKSYAFWDLLTESDIEYFDNTSMRRYPKITQGVALIVMLNNEHLSPADNYNVTHSQKRNELLLALNNNNMDKGIFQVTGILENNLPDVFSGFDVDDRLQEPYSCFRIEGIITYRLECS